MLKGWCESLYRGKNKPVWKSQSCVLRTRIGIRRSRYVVAKSGRLPKRAKDPQAINGEVAAAPAECLPESHIPKGEESRLPLPPNLHKRGQQDLSYALPSRAVGEGPISFFTTMSGHTGLMLRKGKRQSQVISRLSSNTQTTQKI